MNDFSRCSPQQLVEAMADAMRQQAHNCTAETLALAGFSETMQTRYGAAAREIAVQRSTISKIARIPALRAA